MNTLPDDDSELFFHTISSHFIMMLKFIFDLSFNLTSSFTSFKHLFIRLDTVASIIAIVSLIILCHSFDYCLRFNKVSLPIINWFKCKNSSEIVTNPDGLISENVGIYALKGRRSEMEDAFSYRDERKQLGIQMFGIFDGHGGGVASLTVRNRLFNDILEKINQSSSVDSKKLSKIVTEQIIQLDKELVQEMTKRKEFSGTTAIVAISMSKEKTLLVANVGDSRAVLCDREGNVIPLSYDHKPNRFDEYDRIINAGGSIHFSGVWRVAGILAISRALGDYPLKKNNLVIPDPDILSFDLNDLKPQFMILASDGLWDTFSNEEAVELVKKELKLYKKKSKQFLHEIAKSLVWQSYVRGSSDNITVIIALFDKY